MPIHAFKICNTINYMRREQKCIRNDLKQTNGDFSTTRYRTMEGKGKHPNSLANLTAKGRLANLTRETQVKIAKMGAEASNRKQAEKKNLIQLFEIAQQAKVHDAKVAERLENAGLPPTYAGQIAFNVIQKAGVNPLMLQTLLKALGLLNDNPSVTINNVNDPFQHLTDEQLDVLCEKYKLKTE